MFTTLNKKFYGREDEYVFHIHALGAASQTVCSICDAVSEVPSCFVPYEEDEMVCIGQKYILYPVKKIYVSLVSKTFNLEHKNYSSDHLEPTVNVGLYKYS
jgi:hypothetical protein